MTKRKPSPPPERPIHFEGIAIGAGPNVRAMTREEHESMTRGFIAKHDITIRVDGREFHAEPVEGMPGYIKAGKPKRPARRKRR